MSVAGNPPLKLPIQCWQHMANPVAKVLLSAIPPLRQSTPKDSVTIANRALIAEDILASTDPTSFQIHSVDALVEKYAPHTLSAFARSIQHDVIREQIKIAQGRRTDQLISDWRHQYAGKKSLRSTNKRGRKKLVSPSDLPAEFQEAIDGYLAQSKRISDVKHKHGHRYSENTLRRRQRDSWKFCEFLAEKGLTLWPQVGQHHLDEYIYFSNHHAAARVFTFLEYIRHHYRLSHRFVRPKIRLKPVTEAMIPREEVPNLLRRVLKCGEDEVILLALLLALFAQMPARSIELTHSRFRMREGKVEALFAEQWTPLDPMTIKYLNRLDPDIFSSTPGKEDELVFKHTYDQLFYKLHSVLKVSTRRLRLTAIANVIRSGVTDRAALTRILGVSLPTLAYVESSFQWDLQSTVSPEMVKIRNEVIRGEHM